MKGENGYKSWDDEFDRDHETQEDDPGRSAVFLGEEKCGYQPSVSVWEGEC